MICDAPRGRGAIEGRRPRPPIMRGGWPPRCGGGRSVLPRMYPCSRCFVPHVIRMCLGKRPRHGGQARRLNGERGRGCSRHVCVAGRGSDAGVAHDLVRDDPLRTSPPSARATAGRFTRRMSGRRRRRDRGRPASAPTLMDGSIDTWLSRFGLDAFLHARGRRVVDPAGPRPRRPRRGPGVRAVRLRADDGRRRGRAGRPTGAEHGGAVGRAEAHAARRPSAFVRYVIAHEFAHAHLRNARPLARRRPRTRRRRPRRPVGLPAPAVRVLKSPLR